MTLTKKQIESASEPVQSRVERRIRRQKRGSILFPGDFADLGSTEAVKKALLRLSHKGLLKRIAFGIYLYPEQSKLLGTLSPSVDAIAHALAARDKSRIIPTGAYALNRLGMSTQVPMNAVYLTDGTPRKVKVGRSSILFKRTTPKNLSAKGAISALAIQALKAIGAGKVLPEEEQLIIKLLQRENRKHLEHDLTVAPAWIREIFKKALRNEA